jgi:hypothetical protein
MDVTNSKSDKYDIVNTLFNVGVYFNNNLIDYGTGQPLMTRKNGQLVPKRYMKYHLKFIDEKDYQGKDTEMMGMIRVIKNAVLNNSMKRATLYQNVNKGGTLLKEKGENPPIVQMDFRDNKLFQFSLNPKLPDDFKEYFTNVVLKLKSEL